MGFGAYLHVTFGSLRLVSLRVVQVGHLWQVEASSGLMLDSVPLNLATSLQPLGPGHPQLLRLQCLLPHQVPKPQEKGSVFHCCHATSQLFYINAFLVQGNLYHCQHGIRASVPRHFEGFSELYKERGGQRCQHNVTFL
ncbi:hypothetical protein MRX96_017002 [Rhipicephalus microplus]